MNWILTNDGRRYLYRIASIVIIIISTTMGIDGVMSGNIAQLLAAILNLSVSGGTELARKNVPDGQE